MLSNDIRPTHPNQSQQVESLLSKGLCDAIKNRIRSEGEINVSEKDSVKNLFIRLARELPVQFSPSQFMSTLCGIIYNEKIIDQVVGIPPNNRARYQEFLSRNDNRSPFFGRREDFPTEKEAEYSFAASFSCDEFNSYRALYFDIVPALRRTLPSKVFSDVIKAAFPQINDGEAVCQMEKALKAKSEIRSLLGEYGFKLLDTERSGTTLYCLQSKSPLILRILIHSDNTPTIEIFSVVGKTNVVGAFPEGSFKNQETILQFLRDLIQRENLSRLLLTPREKKIMGLLSDSGGEYFTIGSEFSSNPSPFITFPFLGIADETGRRWAQNAFFAAGNSSLQFCHIPDTEKLNERLEKAKRIEEETPDGEVENEALNLLKGLRDKPQEIIELLCKSSGNQRESALLALVALGPNALDAVVGYDKDLFIDERLVDVLTDMGASPPPEEAIVFDGAEQLIERKEVKEYLRYVTQKSIDHLVDKLPKSKLDELSAGLIIESIKTIGERAISPMTRIMSASTQIPLIAAACTIMEAIDTSPGERFELYFTSFLKVVSWKTDSEKWQSLRTEAIEDLLMLLARGCNNIPSQSAILIANLVAERSSEFKKVYEINYHLREIVARSGEQGLEAATILCNAGFQLNDLKSRIEFDIECENLG